MQTWAGLYRRIDELDPLERRAEAERAEFERWAAAAENRLITDLARAAQAKSSAARSRTGVSVAVTVEPSAGLASMGGAHGRVTLSFSGSSVDLYVVRPEGVSPSVHLACQRAPTTSRFPVVCTLPGALAVRAGAGYRLLSLPEKTPTPLDAVVLRAFTILFGSFESVSAMRSVGTGPSH